MRLNPRPSDFNRILESKWDSQSFYNHNYLSRHGKYSSKFNQEKTNDFEFNSKWWKRGKCHSTYAFSIPFLISQSSFINTLNNPQIYLFSFLFCSLCFLRLSYPRFYNTAFLSISFLRKYNTELSDWQRFASFTFELLLISFRFLLTRTSQNSFSSLTLLSMPYSLFLSQFTNHKFSNFQKNYLKKNYKPKLDISLKVSNLHSSLTKVCCQRNN